MAESRGSECLAGGGSRLDSVKSYSNDVWIERHMRQEIAVVARHYPSYLHVDLHDRNEKS